MEKDEVAQVKDKRSANYLTYIITCIFPPFPPILDRQINACCKVRKECISKFADAGKIVDVHASLL